jgi:hypothetical protein
MRLDGATWLPMALVLALTLVLAGVAVWRLWMAIE